MSPLDTYNSSFFFMLCLFSCMSCVTLIEPSHMSCVWHLSSVPHLFTVLRTSSFTKSRRHH
jgi:hypothetical protein